MPTAAADRDSDSAVELSDKADSATDASDNDESVEEMEEDEVVEEEVEEEEEVVEEDEEVEKDDDDVEGEGSEEGEEESGSADSQDSVVPLDVDAHDKCEKLESGRHDVDLKPFSSTSGKSECNAASITQSKNGSGSNLTAHDSPPDMLVVKEEAAYDIKVGDVQSAVQDNDISPEGNGFPKSSVKERGTRVLLGKDKSNEGPGNAKHSSVEDHSSCRSHLSSVNSIGAENTTSLQVTSSELAEENLVRSGSRIGRADGVPEEVVPHLYSKANLQMPEDLSLSSVLSPRQRPRSGSPGASLENLNKRPAIVCDFFAKGWCIKGNSCRFLHQKEGIREDLAGSSKERDTLDGSGFSEQAERLKPSASQELPDISNIETSSKAEFDLQRALVRAYGGESHGSPRFPDGYNSHVGKEFPGAQDVRRSALEAYKSPFGISPHFDSINERRSTSEDYLSRRYLNEGKPPWEMPRGEFLHDASFPTGSSLTRNTLASEYRYFSGGSSTPSSLYQSSNSSFAYDKKSEDLAFHNGQSNFSLPHSYGSHGLSGALRSSFDSPLQPVIVPTSTFSHAGTSNRGSLLFSSEHLGTGKTSDFDRRYYDSSSASLPRSASPYFSRPEVEDIGPNNFRRDLPASVEKKMKVQEDTWEPSVPFRPSFHCSLARISTPLNQYDPLLDSIEPPGTGHMTLQTSHAVVMQNISVPQPHEGAIGENIPAYGLCGQTEAGAALGIGSVDGQTSYVPIEGQHWIRDHAVQNAIVDGTELGDDLGNPTDKDRIIREPKSLKIFRAALVEFVKELIKPAWREGHLSKDAHKIIVKKAVEKVLGALQPHQIPTTAESVSHYLSTSRPKLLKLVGGYVEKYGKTSAS